MMTNLYYICYSSSINLLVVTVDNLIFGLQSSTTVLIMTSIRYIFTYLHYTSVSCYICRGDQLKILKSTITVCVIG